MRELTYYIGTTLDGFAAGPAGEIEFFPVSDDHLQHMITAYPEVLPTHVRTALGCDDRANVRFDTIIQGRATYQPALDLGITSPYAHLRQYVASTGLTETPDPAVTLTTDPLATIRDLKAEDGLGIYLAGGGRLASSVADEIDELVIKVYPVLTGSGIGMFAGSFVPRQLTQVSAQTFSSGTTVITYRPVR